MSSRKKNIIFTVIVAAIILTQTVVFLYATKKDRPAVLDLPYIQFVEKVEAQEVKLVEGYDKDAKTISGELADGTRFVTTKPQDDLSERLLEQGIQVQTSDGPNQLLKFISSIASLILTFGFVYLLIGVLSKKLIRSQTTAMNSNFTITHKSDLTFADVAGNEEAKEELMELGDFIEHPGKYVKFGATIPKGTLLSGSPGNGKTMMVKALAGTIGRPFIATSGSAFVQQYVGVGAARVRELFETASKHAPCIVFIDEIDALGRKRTSGGNGAADERDQTLNQLLVEMDGFAANKGIIVIAATNRPELLDPALLRPGRFDRQVCVEYPDVEAREGILKVHSQNKPLGDAVDMRQIAEMTIGMSGADLKNVMNEAAVYAVRSGHKNVEMTDLERAINKVTTGEEKKNRKGITRRDKEVTAYHEAGHALMSKLLNPNRRVPKVTIIPTTRGAGGYTLLPPEEKMYSTKKDLMNELSISLAGRAAEEIIFGAEMVTSGASSDIRHVTATAARMVRDFGMSEEIGLLSLSELYKDSMTEGSSMETETAIRKLVNEVYASTRQAIAESRPLLYDIAQLLLERETIYQEDLDSIMAGVRPLPREKGSEVEAVPVRAGTNAILC